MISDISKPSRASPLPLSTPSSLKVPISRTLPKRRSEGPGFSDQLHELTLSPSANTFSKTQFLSAVDRDPYSKHGRSSTGSQKFFKFIPATESSPYSTLNHPTVDFQSAESPEDFNYQCHNEGTHYHLHKFDSKESLIDTQPPSSPPEHKFLSLTSVNSRAKSIELTEKPSIGTRLTTMSTEEIRINEDDYKEITKKIYCKKCEENVNTTLVCRNVEKSFWERIVSTVCFRGLGSDFQEVVHVCNDCESVVASIKFKKEEYV